MSSELGVERPTTLPLTEPPVERRVHFRDADGRPCSPSTPSPRKPRPDPDFRPKRKRSLSFCGAGGDYRGNKRRKRGRVLPSKFLLGGSITDPLNLGSLDDEEELPPVGRVEGGGGSGSTAGCNKRWAAVRVIIPPNINDPLNLDASSDNEDLLTDAFHRSLRRRRRNRKRKRRLSEPGDTSRITETENIVTEAMIGVQEIPVVPLPDQVQDSLKPLTINTELPLSAGLVEPRRESVSSITPTGTKPSMAGGSGGMPRIGIFKKQRSKSDNKIVSPVIPQPGGERKRHPSHNRHYADKPHLSQQNLRPPASFNPKNEVFQYGNYNKYYGYRNPTCTPDPRLQYLKREWCEGREVLDVGCNIGHIALTIARDYSPKRVVGVDIDKKLINIAGKNIKHYLRTGDPEESVFPSSMRLLYGPLKTPVRADGTRAFPYNIKFLHANYVLESDELLETVRPEFDLILCLSITKWIHLNWGDSGLKRLFRRSFHNLKPGGRLVLEPQAWPSYNKRRKLTKRIFDNYKSIRLFPDKFNDFLLHDVGFSTSEKMGTPHHTARGFQRPVIVYTKAGGSNKCSPAVENSGRETGTSQASTSQTTGTCHQCEDQSGEGEVSSSSSVITRGHHIPHTSTSKSPTSQGAATNTPPNPLDAEKKVVKDEVLSQINAVTTLPHPLTAVKESVSTQSIMTETPSTVVSAVQETILTQSIITETPMLVSAVQEIPSTQSITAKTPSNLVSPVQESVLTQSTEVKVEINKDKKNDHIKSEIQEVQRKSVPINPVVSNQQGPLVRAGESDKSDNSDSSSKTFYVCDTKVTGASEENNFSITHSSQPEHPSSPVGHCVDLTSNIRGAGSSRHCSNCCKDSNLKEHKGTDSIEVRTVSVSLKCECSDDMAGGKQTPEGVMTSGEKTEEKCSKDSEILSSTRSGDGEVSKTSIVSEVSQAESTKSPDVEERSTSTQSPRKRKHLTSNPSEEGVPQADDTSKKLRLEDT